jgi:hypothetical protein
VVAWTMTRPAASATCSTARSRRCGKSALRS